MSELKNSLAIMGCDEYTTIEEIKTKFRELAKTYHPDSASETKDANKFIEINKAYQFLLKNHIPRYQARPIDFSLYNVYYEFLDSKDTYKKIYIPETSETGILKRNAILNVMIDEKEYRLGLKEGTEFPIKLNITNPITGAPLILELVLVDIETPMEEIFDSMVQWSKARTKK